MKIVYDHQIFVSQYYGGISRYFYNLSKELSLLDSAHVEIISPVYVNGYLKQEPLPFVRGISFPPIPKTGSILRGLIQPFTNWQLQKIQPNILHETDYNSSEFSDFSGLRVITIYDMIHEHYPSLFSRFDRTIELKRKAIKKADFIICISDSTRNDLLKIVDFPEDRTATIYLGFNTLSDVLSLNSSKYFDEPQFSNHFLNDLSRPNYLLYVGDRSGYKNFSSFIRAYSSSKFLKDNISILCFGFRKPTHQERRLVADLGISPNVKFVGGDDIQLALAYQNAAAFIYPSLYEGFGIAPLEAMSLGCPVICSNTSSIPEVVGNAGEYFDPRCIDDMANTIERVILSSERQAELIRLGYERCKLFSWRRCAEQTFSIYKSIV